jgi:hypothetical protein
MKENGASFSSGLARYSSETVFQFRIFGSMLSPESGGNFTLGCSGGLVCVTGGTTAGAGVDLVSEVWQPAKSATAKPALAAAEMVRLSENISALVRHFIAANKFQN